MGIINDMLDDICTEESELDAWKRIAREWEKKYNQTQITLRKVHRLALLLIVAIICNIVTCLIVFLV